MTLELRPWFGGKIGGSGIMFCMFSLESEVFASVSRSDGAIKNLTFMWPYAAGIVKDSSPALASDSEHLPRPNRRPPETRKTCAVGPQFGVAAKTLYDSASVSRVPNFAPGHLSLFPRDCRSYTFPSVKAVRRDSSSIVAKDKNPRSSTDDSWLLLRSWLL